MNEESIDVLKPDPANPRKISGEALAGLGVSMATFGDLSTVVWNRRSGRLVAGHQRMAQLRAAGVTTWRRNDKGGEIVHPKTGERFPVRIVDWDETTERMANLAANNPEIQGEFTPEALAQLRAVDADINYGALRLDELARTLEAEMGDAGGPAAGNTDPDEVPPVPKVPVTKPGDLWTLGEHRLLCGDSTKAEDVARLMGGERAVLGLHDPPYGIGIQDKEGRVGGAKKRGSRSKAISRAKAYPVIEGDDRPFDPAHLLASGGTVVIWGANHFAHKLPASAAWICWDKTGDLSPTDFSEAELAWCSAGGRIRMFRMLWRGLIRAGKTEDGPVRVHPTQKPIALYRWIIEQYTQAGDVVFDAYAGSGPTVMAAQSLGRRARAAEKEPAYCDVIVTRWEAFTGKKATRQPAPRAPKAARPKPAKTRRK